MQRVQPAMEVIVIDDEDGPGVPKPSDAQTCYLCRKSAGALTLCSRCLRPFHSACLPPSASKTAPQLCSDCQGFCGKCSRLNTSEKLRCPRCALAFHPGCEPLLNELRTHQICSICLSEVQTNVREHVEARYEPRDLYGQRYARVKVKDMSYLHIIYLPENMVQGIPISEQGPPVLQFECVLRWKDVGSLRMGLVKFANKPESESAWEYEFVIKGLKPDQYAVEEWTCHDQLPGLRPPPQISPKMVIEKAQELILAFGFDPEDSSAGIRRA